MANNHKDILFHQDTIHCCQIFPIETWQLITKRLHKCPNAVENLVNSSPFFRHFFAYQNSKFILKKALAIVVPYIWSNQGEQVFPLKEFLKCRQLNSHWNRLVDKLLVDNFKISENDNNTEICPEIQSMVQYNFSSLYTPNKLTNFLNHFQLTHYGQLRSPFVCPELSIHTHTTSSEIIPDEQQFLDGISTLLQKYGSHVREFKIDIEGAALVTLSTALQFWLGQVKNLKRLKIEYDERARDARRPAQIRIPKFNQLESLETSKLPAHLFNKLIHQNSHNISSLKVQTWEENYNFLHALNTQIEIRTFSNLKTLEMSINQRNVFDNLVSPLVQFPVLSQLSLWFNSSNRKYCLIFNIEWSEIFQMIQNKFAKTLEYVFLKLPLPQSKVLKVQNYQDSLFFRLCLPKLREISLELWSHTSLDFLLPVKDTLEIIDLNIKYSEKDEIKMTMFSIVQLYGYEEKIWTSNIPYIFTNLERIRVRTPGSESVWYSRTDWTGFK